MSGIRISQAKKQAPTRKSPRGSVSTPAAANRRSKNPKKNSIAEASHTHVLETTLRQAQRELADLKQRAQITQTKLEKSVEEYQVLNEELKSANEEYLTINEEMNSVNEEYLTVNEELSSVNQQLDASQKELQSVNAELSRVNSSLRERVDELTRAEAEIRHQASFPLLNPNPVLELDLAGKLMSCNQATRDTLQRLSLEDVSLFNPRDLDQVLKNFRHGGAESCLREIELGERIFNEFIYFVPQFQTVRIYAADVTDARRAYRFLAESEARFRSVFDHSQDVIYRFNLQTGRYEYMNPAIRALAKFEPEEMMAMSNAEVLSRVHPEDLPALQQALARLPETEEVQVEYRFRGKDDQYIWWSNYLILLKDEAGRPLYRDGFVRNITENKRVEMALRGSEAQYHALFSGMTEGFALHEIIYNEAGEPVDYRFLDINPAFERLTGLRRENVVGRTHNELLPADSPRWVQEYGRVVLTGESVSFDNYSPELKKHYEVFAYCPAPLQFAVIFKDVTVRRLAEKELRSARDESERRAREAEAGKRILDALLEYIPEGITIAAAPDVVTVATSKYALNLLADGWAESAGMSMEDWLAKVEHFQEDGRTPAGVEDLPLWRAIKFGETCNGRELILRRPNGTLMPISCNAGPIRDNEGHITGAIVGWRDISSRKEADAVRNRLVAKLQEVVTETEQQRAELEAIFTAHNDPVLIYDPQRKVQRINPAFQAIFGFDPTGMKLEEIIPRLNSRRWDGAPLDLEKQPTPAVLRGEAPAPQQFLVQAADAQVRVMETTARPMLQGQRIIGAVTVMHDITARMQAEEDLRHSEERYRRLVEQSPDAVLINRNNRVEYLNPAALKLFGAFTPEKILEKSPFELFHPSYHALIQGRIARLLRGETAPLIEGRVLRLDGTFREAEITASLFTDREGSAIQVILHDVTDRKKKENELYRLNWILNALSDSSQALMHAQEESAYLEEVCRIVVEDCGHSLVWIGYVEENAGKTVRPVAKAGFEDGYLETLAVTWEDTERGRGPTGTAVRTGEMTQCRNMLTDPKFLPWRQEAAKRGYASSVAIPLASSGKVFGAITIYAQEPEAFADDELKLLVKLADNLAYGISAIRLRQAHARAEEDFRALAENSPDSITRLGADMRHLYANPMAHTVLGVDIAGKTWREAGLPPEFLSVWEPIFQRVFKTGKGETCEDAFISTGERIPKYYSCRIIPEFDADGRVRSVLIMRSDITELKQLTNNLEKLVSEKSEEVLQARVELERAHRMADIGRLASTVAHEMRNPLAAIRMAAYNIERKAANPNLGKHLQTINKKVIESDQIIQNLLNFSRIKRASFELVDLPALLGECLATIAVKYPGQEVRLEKHLESAACSLIADPTQLGMLFTNLLDNAHQALADNAAGTVGVLVRPADDSSWAVTVKDTGMGIPEEYLGKIFDPFFTTKSKGTGLGLAVCREIAELHHGKIYLQSTLGQGTEFTVVLPKEQPLETEQPGNGREEAANPL